MFLGHYAPAMAAKKVAPKASLGTLVLSAQFADCLWPLLLVFGFAQVRIVPGITRVTPLDLVSYPISHSLLIQLMWGLLLAAIYFFPRKDLMVEFAMFAAGIVLYLTERRSKGGTNYRFWSFVLFLGVIYPASSFGPPPPSARVLALSALALWLTIPWAAWGDPQREAKLAE